MVKHRGRKAWAILRIDPGPPSADGPNVVVKSVHADSTVVEAEVDRLNRLRVKRGEAPTYKWQECRFYEGPRVTPTAGESED